MAKILHTSDWHIGRLFQNYSLLEDQASVLSQIKQIAKEHAVDAMIVAGDIFDRSVPPAEAVDLLGQFLTEFIRDVSIPIIMISGNHDSEKRLRFGAEMMTESGLHILGDIRKVEQPVRVQTKSGEIDIFGLPYHDPVTVREVFDTDVSSYDEAHTFLVEKVKQVREPSRKSILVSHCFVDGAAESDSERRLSIGGADRVSFEPMLDFDYVALGHLHSPQYKGAEHIRYSGSILKYSFSEHAQRKAVTLVDLSKSATTIEQVDLKPSRDVRILEGTLDELIERGKTDPGNQDFIFARLTDTQDLLEPMSRLRQSYPNTLELERTNFVLSAGSRLQTDMSPQRTEDDVFSDFFSQVMDDELSDQQRELLHQVIEEARKDLEGAE